MSARHRIVVHSLDHALAALDAAAALQRPVTLVSAEGAGAALGAPWFLALVAEARAAHPDADADSVLDCADEAGAALAALRLGAKRVRFTGTAEALAKLTAIASALGATVEADASPALDLLDAPDPAAAVRAHLGGAA